MKPSLYQPLPKSRRLSPKLTVFIALWLFIPPLLYAQTAGLTETFSTQTLPAGWQVLPADAGNNGWVFNNPNQRGADWSTPPSNFALADGFLGTAITTELRTPVLNLIGRSAVTLKFKTWFYTQSGSAEIEVSTDNGNLWTNVWSMATNLNAVPLSEQTVDLSKSAGNQARVIVRFRANNMVAVWMVDDVIVDALTVPTAPTNLTATLGQNSVVNLSWQGEDTAKFDIERSPDGNNWQKITDNSMSAKSYIDSSVASSTAYQYRVRATNAAGNSDYSNLASVMTADRSVITYDVTVSYYDTYANTVPSKQVAIEENIKNLADAVYEMSNGAQKLGQVTIYTDGAVKDRADIVWQKDVGDSGEACWFNAYTGGRATEKGPGKRIQHCDIGRNYPQYDTLSNPKVGGYTLGHEWGHYFFGLFDEYAQGPASSTDPGDPLSTDTAVPNAIMNDSSGALQGDYSWLNFSTSLNNQGSSNAQFRKYGASAWDTVTRPPEQDPADVGFRRPYYPELKVVAPAAGQAPTIELSSSGASTAARSALKIDWKKGAEAPTTRARPGSQSVATVRVAVIDHSNSVSSTHLEEVKSAMQHWVSSANIGDYLGIISFDSTPTVVQPLIPIEGQATKDAIIQAIEGITASSNPPALGEALQSALTSFKTTNAPEELVWAVYLFTSGQNVTGPAPLDALLSYQEEDVMLHTFDLGEEESATATLQQLAEATDGEYWISADFDGLMTGLDNADEVTSPTVDVTITQGEDTVATAKDFSFYIDSTIGSLDLYADYGGGMTEATLTLVDPTGNPYLFTEKDCEMVGDSLGEDFQSTSCEVALDNLSAGTWTLKVATSQPQLDFSYGVTGFPKDNDDTVFASVDSINGEELEYPQPMLITASVGKDLPITGVAISGSIEQPDGSAQDLTLRDDGVSPDAEANDGLYTTKVDYTMAGDYYITVSFNNHAGTATFSNYGVSYVPDPTGKIPDLKLSPVGENFERVADLQVTVTGVPAGQYDATGKFIGLATTPETTNPPAIVTPPLTTTTGELILTEEDNGKTVELQTGNTLKVIFTTPLLVVGSYGRTHEWHSWSGGSQNEAIVKSIDVVSEPEPTGPWLTKQIHTFEAVSTGQTALVFQGGFTGWDVANRPLALATFSVTVVVKSGVTPPTPTGSTTPPVTSPSPAVVTPPLTTTTGELILTEERDNGKTVELQPGNQLKIMFRDRSMYGSYGITHPWQSWGKISGDEAIVKQIGGITSGSDSTNPGLLREILTFETVGTGQTVLVLAGGPTGQNLIGEPLSPSTFTVTVVVKAEATPPTTTAAGPTTPPVTSPSPVVTPPVAAISLVTTCPTSGTISNFCNAEGKTLTDVKIEAPANVSKATLSGQIDNQGWVSNSTIAKDATLTGGTLTGSIKNQGTISDIKFVGMLLEGGTLAGTITNASRVGGTIKNVHFAANAKLSGGKLAGEIQGNCDAPAQLNNLTVVAGSKLTCVTIGSKVVLGKGVTVESPTTTTPTTPPVETNDLPSLGEGVATDAKGKTVTTTAKFAGGVSLNDSKTFAQAPTAKVLADSLNIQGQITVDAKDVKQTANLVVFLTYQTTAEEKPVPLMLDSNGGLLPWDEKPASLVPFRKEVVLEATQTVDVYKGVLLTTGLLKITFGYQLKDGTLVQSPNTIDLTVATETSSETADQVLTETDNGKTIELSTGKTLKVTLASNPTTGYSWEKTTGDETILKQLGEADFVSDPHPEGMTGVGGQETFTFEAAGTGKTTLTLVYHRPFETDTLPIRTFEVKVVVK